MDEPKKQDNPMADDLPVADPGELETTLAATEQQRDE
jgi:hypothetical protein